MAAVLLDTCTIVFIVTGEPLAEAGHEAIASAAVTDGALVSPVSAWEIGLLAAKRRVEFRPDPKTWFTRFLAQNGIGLAPLTPEAAIEASHLPYRIHAHPADRLLIATARSLGIAIVTRDRQILRYRGVKSIAC